MNKARRVSVQVLYNSTNITKDIAPYLKSFHFNDVMSGAADDIELHLEDVKHLWQADWLPEKGAMLDITLKSESWQDEGERTLPLGLFEIDEIEISNPPSEVTIKAVSVPNNSALRGVDKSRSWEKATLHKIAQSIAGNAGLKLFYDGDDSEFDRAEQSHESDLAFLQQLCNDRGKALKVTDDTIVIFDEESYEAKDSVKELHADDVTTYRIRSKTREIYGACHVKYQNSKKKKHIEATFKAKEGKTLEINEEVKSVGEALKLAKKKLREKNKEEITVDIIMMGDFDLLAGNTVTLVGFGAFNGKYIITNGKHNIWNGYTLSLNLRRCLNGY